MEKNDLRKQHEGFNWDECKFKSILSVDKEPIYILEKDSKFGIGITLNENPLVFDVLLACEYDNIFTIGSPHQELTGYNEYNTFIYSFYFVLVKEDKQGLCRIRYNKIKPTVREEYTLYYESDIEYDYITVCGHRGYILLKGKENRYFSASKKSLTEPFASYRLVDYNYLMFRREDGTYVIDTVDDCLYKITSDVSDHIFYLGSRFFADCHTSDNLYMITDNGVQEFKNYKYEYSLSIGREKHISFLDTYIVVTGSQGFGVSDKNGEFIITPEQDEITPELVFRYFQGEYYGEKYIRID